MHPCLCLFAGDWETEEWEANVGAQAALGRDEISFWGPALPPVDQPFRRISDQATSARKERRTWVCCLSLNMLELARILYNIYFGGQRRLSTYNLWPGETDIRHLLVASRVFYVCCHRHLINSETGTGSAMIFTAGYQRKSTWSH